MEMNESEPLMTFRNGLEAIKTKTGRDFGISLEETWNRQARDQCSEGQFSVSRMRRAQR